MHITTTKRLQLAAAISTIVVTTIVPADAQQAPVAAQCPAGNMSVAQYRDYARAVYRRDTIKTDAIGRLRYMVRCQHSAWATRQVTQLRKRFKAQRIERKRADRCTPYGEWAIPGYIVMRESRGDPHARNSSSTAGGFYQIIDSTWWSAGGTHYADSHPAAVAPEAEQHCVAHRLWAGGAGSHHWALTR